MPRSYAAALDARFAQLRPWPDVQQTLTALKAAGVTIGVVTNCSERLGRIAAGCLGIEIDVLVTAERAGFYKPHPRTYGLAIEELGVAGDRCLFVAGSAYDLFGTAKVGLPAYWHDRLGMTPPAGMPEPIARERTLGPLLQLVLR